MLDYLAHLETIPVQKMTIEAAFSEVVKAQAGINSQVTVLFATLSGSGNLSGVLCQGALSGCLAPPSWRRLDQNPPLADAHHRARQGLF